MKNAIELILMIYCLIVATLYLVSVSVFVWYLIGTVKTLPSKSEPKQDPTKLSASQLKTKAYQEIGEPTDMDGELVDILSESTLVPYETKIERPLPCWACLEKPN